MNILAGINDSLAAASAVVLDYKNPNTPNDKAAVVSAVAQVATDFGQTSASSQTLGGLVADAIEQLNNDPNAINDLATDIVTQAAAHGIQLSALELMAVSWFVGMAETGIAKLVAAKK
jgi:cytochrome P450